MAKRKRVLIITANSGVEKSELLHPLEHLQSSGFEVVHAAPKRSPVQTSVMDENKDITVTPNADFSSLQAKDFDALVVPGGTVNADKLRINEDAIRIAEDFAKSGKPIAAVCHGPWLLVNARLVRGKTLTSYQTLSTDIENAGGHWVDEPVVRSDEDGWTLITSRNPADLDAFTKTITQELNA